MQRTRIRIALLAAIGVALFPAACVWPPPSEDVIIPDTTKVLDDGTVAALTSVTEDELRFEEETALLADVAPGDVIVVPVSDLTPYGLLRTVDTIQADGAQVMVRTGPATLPDAILQGTVTLHRTLTRDDLAAGALASAESDGIRVTALATGLAIAFDDVALNDAGTVRASGNLVIEPTLDLTIRISLTEGLEEVGFRFGATQGASLEIVGDDAAQFDKEVTIGTPLIFAPIVVDVGGVPVVFTPIVSFVAGGNGEVTGHLYGQVSQRAEYSVGLAYENGSIDATHTKDLAAQSDPPLITSSASTTLYTGPRFEMLMYGILGPHVEVDAYARANAAVSGFPSCLQWDLVAGLAGFVGFDFILDYEAKVFDASETIAERGDCTDGDPARAWSRTFASDAQSVQSIQRTEDGGFITAGYHMDVARNEPFGASVMRHDADGGILWQRAYSYRVTGFPSAIRRTADGGYLFGSGGWATGSSNEAVVSRIDANGNLIWAKAYDANDGRPLWPEAIAMHVDGSFAVAGSHGWSTDAGDVWVASFAEDGTPLWSKSFGSAGWDLANDLLVLADGSHVIAATNDAGGSGGDLWVLELDRDGDVTWQTEYGGGPINAPTFGGTAATVARYGSGYLLLGEVGGAEFDTIVLQLEEDGTLAQSFAFDANTSSPGFDGVSDLLVTQDGGFVIAGGSGNERWLFKSGGSSAWHKVYAVSGSSVAISGDDLLETADGSLVVASSIRSCSGSSACEAWLMQVTKNGAIEFDDDSGAYVANANATIYGPDVSVRDTAVTAMDTAITVTDITAEVEVDVTDVSESQQAP